MLRNVKILFALSIRATCHVELQSAVNKMAALCLNKKKNFMQ